VMVTNEKSNNERKKQSERMKENKEPENKG
jgi:hypothetical protein